MELNHLWMSMLLFVFQIKIYLCAVKKYEVYESNNNYPRPLLLHNNDVIGFSGINPGYLIKYNRNAEVILKRKTNFPYHSNADVIELKGQYEGKYVLVSGENVTINITLFDENGIIKETVTSYYSNSYKISLIPLSTDGMILMGWVNTGEPKPIKVATFSLQPDNTFLQVKNDTWETDNRYISCVEMQSNKDIVCMYVANKCNEYYKVFDSSLGYHNFGHIGYSGIACGFDKIIKIDGDTMAMCFLQNNEFNCTIRTHYTDYSVAINVDSTWIMGYCNVNSNQVDTSFFATNKFIATCIRYDSKLAQVAIVTYEPTSSSLSKKVITCSGPNADYPRASKFGDNFLSIFYRSNSDNVYEIMEFPFCEDFTQSLYINSKTTFEIGDYIVHGSGDEVTNELKMYFPELPAEGVVTFSNSTEILIETPYSKQTFQYFSSENDGTFILKFAGYNYQGKVGKWCKLTFTVLPCYEGCFTCSSLGTASDNQCNGCKTGYYPIKDKTGSCASAVDNYYLNKDDVDNPIWKPCYETCETCEKDYTATEQNCKTCKTGFYLLEGDTTGTCTQSKDGYYLDSSSNMLKKCYQTCATCQQGGTADSNNCKSCAPNNYPFESITGKCDSQTDSSTSNYYKDETDSNDIKFKICDISCATCSGAGANACSTCASSYKPIENTNQCSAQQPSGYYEDKTDPSNPVYRQCDSACLECSAAKDSTSTHCKSCANGYIPYFDDTTNCVNSQPNGYYEFTDANTGNVYYKKCYDTCASCNTGGDVNNNNCIDCLNDYYHTVDSSTICVKDPNGYYLDDNNIYQHCNSACSSCNGASTPTSTNCKESQCANGYYPIKDDLTNCVNKRPDGYFLDPTDNTYKKCNSACKTCNGEGTGTDFQCTSCNTNSYMIDGTSNCYANPLEGYYVDSSDPNNVVFKPCESTCKACSGQKTDQDNCIECKVDFYFIKDTSNCVQGNQDGYYFNSTDNNYQKCYSTCKACSEYGDNNENNCDECQDNFYKKDGTDNCYNSPPDHYYKDDGTSTYKPCDSSCDTCTGPTTCTLCLYDNGYYPKDGDVSPYVCYTEQTKDSNYYLDSVNKVFKECYEFCATCSQGGNVDDNNCSLCKAGYYPIEGITGSCVKDPLYYYLDNGQYKECYQSCKTCEASGTSTTNNCLTCKDNHSLKAISGSTYFNCLASCLAGQYYFQGLCQTCPTGTFIQDPYCINCKDTNKYSLEGETQCVDHLPTEGYYKESEDINYYKKCDTKCLTCDSALTCLTCKSTGSTPIFYNNDCISECPVENGVQLYELDGTCVTCPNYLYANPTTKKCESCYPKYKNINVNECSDALPPGGHKLEDTYNSFDMCYPTCDSCNSISTDPNNQDCITCKSTDVNGDNLFLQPSQSTNCLTTCPTNLVLDTTQHKCINCKTDNNPPQYKDINDDTQCKTSKPSNAYISDLATNTYSSCYPHCASCQAIGTSDTDMKCLTCDSTTYKQYNTQNCITDCTNKYVHDDINRICINCQATGNFKYEDENECINPKPSNSYDIDTGTGTIGKCHNNCATCSGAPETDNMHCITCKPSFYLQPDNVNCLSECDDFLVEDSTRNKCINCAGEIGPTSNQPMYKYLDKNYCIEDKPAETIIDDNYPGYNILLKCYEACSSCSSSGTADNQNCIGCAVGYFLQLDRKTCLTDCGPHLVKDEQDHKCINCKENSGNDKYLYLSNNQCIERPPHTYIIDEQYNTIGNCYSTCNECYGAGNDNDHNCTSCNQGTFKEVNGNNCITDCTNNLVSDSVNRECINCAPNKYKYPESNKCEDTLPVGTYVTNSTYNILGNCYTTCSTCSSSGDDLNHNCDTCATNLFKEGAAPTNCISSCGVNLATDDANKQCINCKYELNVDGSPSYKAENSKVCLPSLPPNAYITNEEYNTFKYCDVSCATCENDHSCLTCADDYIKHPFDNTKCVRECDLTKSFWYITDDNEYQCTDNSSCDNIQEVYRGIMEETNKQCVKNCNSNPALSFCLACTTNTLYEHEGKCVETCPDGYYEDTDTSTCIEEVDDGICVEHILNNSDNNLSNIADLVGESVNEYMTAYSSNSMSQVNIIKGNAYTIQIFKTDQCQYDSSINNHLSYANFTECEAKILVNNSSLSQGDIIFVKVDINKTTEATNQVSFKAYNKHDGSEIDLSPCSTIKIYYPISSDVNLTLAEQMANIGVDVFNKDDPFFNDFCYPYYTEDGKDVVLMDRRSDYFQNNSLCEAGCNYNKVNFKTAMVECECNVTDSMIDNVNDIISNMPIGNFDSLFSMDNLIVVRCYNLVFNFTYMKKNIGCWILICFFLLQWPGVINFMVVGFKPIYAYLNKFSRQRQMNENMNNNEEEEESESNNVDNNSITNSDQSKSLANPPKRKPVETDGLSNNDNTNFDTPAQLIEKKKVKTKLTMLDLNKNNNYMGDSPVESKKDLIQLQTKLNTRTESDNGFTSNNNLKDTDTQEKQSNDADFEEEDLDDLVFEDAVEYDTRGFCAFLWRAMKLKLIILSPFSNISVLEPFCFRLLAFFLNLALFFVFNGIFYDPDYISDRYKEDGSVDFAYLLKKEIPRTIYASLASTVIGLLFMSITSTKKRFLTVISKEKDHNVFLKKTKQIVSSMKCKLIVFFIMNLILMFAFWYYVSAFCAVYQKTQNSWLEGSLITFLFCLILQALYALFITCLRYMGLKCKISCCYTISKYML